MANTFAPNGFAEAYRLGAAPNYQMSQRLILPANTTPIYRNDAVIPLSSGYIAQATASTVQLAGIFVGCEYTSISQKKRVWLPYWGGNTSDVSDAAIIAQVIIDPEMVFVAQGNGQITQAMVGLNAQLVVGTGNATTGFSGMSIDTVTNVPANTTTFPFKILGLVDAPPSANGADPTTAFNKAYVTFNNQDFRVLTGV